MVSRDANQSKMPAQVGTGMERLIASAQEPVVSSGGLWVYCGGGILWALAFYAIQRVSIPHVLTREMNWRYLWGLLAFIAVAWFGRTWPSLIAQAVITVVILCLLVLSPRPGREETEPKPG